MTIEELRELVTTARDGSVVSWDGTIAVEEANGVLHTYNVNAATTLRAYNIALEQLAKQAPSLEDARLLLSGAKNLEAQRGGEQTATQALVSLAIYEAAPHHGESFGSSWSSAVSIST